METPTTKACIKSPRARWWIVAIATALIVAGYVGFMLFWETPAAFVVLPDGTKIVYHSADRGRPESGFSAFMTYEHVPPTESKVRKAWQWLRQKTPAPLAKRLPEWPGPRSTGRSSPRSELELRFQFFGNRQLKPYDIGIADENGWETLLPDSASIDGSKTGDPGWLFLGGSYPRHSKTIRVRFHPGKKIAPHLSEQEQREVVAELVLDNPFYEGPSPPPAHAVPLTQPFHEWEITLEKLQRGPLVSETIEDLKAELSVRRKGQLSEELEFSNMEITDSSRQQFRWNRAFSWNNGAHHGAILSTAPWSDDLCWTLHFKVGRADYFPRVPEDEKIVFDHLPRPRDSAVPVNRTATAKGITLRITTLEPHLYGLKKETRFHLEGGDQPKVRGVKRIIILDARDDQGRTHLSDPSKSRLVVGPVGGDNSGPLYSVQLEPDAKWWSLTLAPTNDEPMEFQAQPSLVRAVK